MVTRENWLLRAFCVLSLLHARTAASEFESFKIRHHNRLSPLYEPRRYFSKYPKENLMKHEYKTVEENLKSVSRFKKLDKLLQSLPRQKLSEGPTSTRPDLEMSLSSPYDWSFTTENPILRSLRDEEKNNHLSDEFFVEGLILETPAKAATTMEGWENNIESDASWVVLPTAGKDLINTTITTSSTTTSTLSPSTTTAKASSHHSQAGQSQAIHVHKTASFTQRHRKFSLSAEEIARKIEDKKNAKIHIDLMEKEGLCRVPLPKIIHVKDVYPHTSKTYLPHCTILHQCGGDTGCCPDERHTCRAKTTKLVSLHFYTHVDYIQKIERLDFYNHTECECQPREDRPSNDAALATPETKSDNLVEKVSPTNSACVCPRKFSVRYLPDGTCICDCFHMQKDCLKLKRGKDNFPREDQLCIKKSTCMLPSCEYGHYLRKKARCVRKQEMFAYWPKYSVQDGEN